MCLYDYTMHACSCYTMNSSGLICMYSGGACMFSNHSMVASLRGNDTMKCVAVASKIMLDDYLDVGTS